MAELAAAWITLRRGTRIPGLIVLSAVLLANGIRQMPEVNTNRLLCMIVAATVLGAIALGCMARGRASQWAARAAPALRWELVVVYAWAGWDKLNRDFIDPQFSCGPFLLHRLIQGLGHLTGVNFPPVPRMADLAVIWGTILIELGAPFLLLLSGRFRLAGVAVLAAFSVVLGLAGFYGFSSTMLALLVLFLPPEWLEQARCWWMGEAPHWSRAILRVVGADATWGMIIAAGFAVSLLTGRGTHAAFWVLWLLAVAGAGGAILSGLWRPAPPRPDPAGIWRMPLAMGIFPILTFLNGLCPYIGLKTETCFAMYSNLRTEGAKTNHLIIGRPLALFPYLEDLAVIEGSSDASLARIGRQGLPIPWVQLQMDVHRLRQTGAGTVSLSYTRDGRRNTVADAFTSPEFAQPPAWWQVKLLRFRDILPAGQNGFSH